MLFVAGFLSFHYHSLMIAVYGEQHYIYCVMIYSPIIHVRYWTFTSVAIVKHFNTSGYSMINGNKCQSKVVCCSLYLAQADEAGCVFTVTIYVLHVCCIKIIDNLSSPVFFWHISVL